MQRLTPWLTLSPDAPVDLQMHTSNSDGSCTPQELVDYLVKEQFALVAITDHERVDTVAQVQRYAAERGLHVLAAVEMSTNWHGRPTDILCFGFDPAHHGLGELARRVRDAEEHWARQMLDALEHEGYRFARQQEVLKNHRGQPKNAGDIYELLLQHGYVHNEQEFNPLFEHLVASGLIQPYDPYRMTNDLVAVVAAAHQSGAICILAHPGRGGTYPRYTPTLLDQLLAEVPLDGIEAYYPTHSDEQREEYLAYARQHNLLVSSGSDSHGLRAATDRAPIKYPARLSQQLLERLGVQLRA
ncbi:PHP domain-containing protein [Dictyobacter aurantiacus]|uniref:Phosphatase n=1 Tax=Dictyobacter aurantiacus TaxID=1936993 RepID=A0A401ZK45_9CHLR|nr:PHP domain-containing protein [Dictyobacter aurantiacus]GCE07226.1 phosphatase [Dictyobacter aurantiacus]